MDTNNIIKFLKPKACPFPLVRIGGNRDGAYLIPDDLSGIHACFSPGSNNVKEFEDDILERYGIGAHICDKSSDLEKFSTPLWTGQSFIKKWISTKNDSENITLQSWVSSKAPGNQDLVMQMDIEGAEYDVISGTPLEVLRRFRIIAIELHALHKLNDLDSVRETFSEFFRKLSHDFTCVHLHPNNAAQQVQVIGTEYYIPRILEITLLRKDRFEASPMRISPRSPHPQDIPYNVAHKPPHFMARNWFS